jgi:hypothetical protein
MKDQDENSSFSDMSPQFIPKAAEERPKLMTNFTIINPFDNRLKKKES